MTTALFIHGTGVREPGFSGLYERFTDGLGEFAPDVRVAPYYWGGELGARLGAGGLSLPYTGGRSRGGLGEEADAADGTELWADLYRDPLAELAAAAGGFGSGGPAYGGPAYGVGHGGELPPGAPLPAERPRALLAALDGHVGDIARATGLPAPSLTAAVAALSGSPVLAGAATAVPDDEELARLLARALVAAVLRALLDADAPVIPDGAARDAAAAALAERMGARPEGSERGIKAVLARPVLRIASHQVVRRRRALTEAAHPAAADIMLYLAHGEPLRQRLREVVDELEPPVVVIGHSLGGIIALDTLITSPLPRVALLVTVGSQGPFLYESGALPGLVHPEPLPDHLPDWLNVYDRRDLLGYVGAPLFPGRVTDVEVDNRQPFPAAHSAYWTNPAVYQAIAARLP
ncbi:MULTISPECIES: alpha/beta fold hydrolase [unclassified Streptomyces]|uniref:alpha/beta fold hydrolase n=1 Tax=unclassified Streptomyces TaxID=2593676 RepID=UPI00224FEF83|nr:MULTISPECIES: alpha/beta fold hydrolase [unclassified Streptomyces]MCX4528798.1 alpha/beta fold hydrolase [Streptomyces sp. NBC_01551]MCX4540594.1 alpha/beta fold hydrolase [Streptomyces sp. NBC_01565]